MAALAVAYAGSYIGGTLLGGGLLGAQLGWFAGSTLYSSLNPQRSEGPRLGDLRVTGSDYGQTIPYAEGSPRISGQVAWASAKREIATTESAGKGGGAEYTSYTYEVDVLYLLTENQISNINRAWINGELVYNNGTTKTGVWSEMRVYTGASNQLPDPDYEADVGVGNAPAYRGRGTVLIKSLQLGSSGALPNLTFELNRPSPDSNLFFSAQYCYDPAKEDDRSAYEKGLSLTNSANTILNLDGSITFNSTNARLLLLGSQDVAAQNLAPFGLPENHDWSVEFTLVSMGDRLWTGSLPTSQDPFFHDIFVTSPSGSYISMSMRLYVLVRYSVGLGQHRTELRFEMTGVGSGTIDPTLLWGLDWTSLSGEIEFKIARINNTVKVLGGPPNVCRPLDELFSFVVANPSPLVDKFIQDEHAIGNDQFYSRQKTYNHIRAFYQYTPYSDATFRYALHTNRATLAVLQAGEPPYLPYLDLTPPGPGLVDRSNVTGLVNRLLTRCGYDAQDKSVVSLASEAEVYGVTLSQVAGTRTALELLQQALNFYAVASDRLYIKQRQLTPVVFVDYEDLATTENESKDEEPLPIKTASDLELPAQVSLTYNNILSDYNAATEYTDRLISDQNSVSNINMPLGLTPSKAKAVCNEILFDQISSLSTSRISVPLKYAAVEPGDLIEVPDQTGRTYAMRVQAKKETLVSIELDLTVEDLGARVVTDITDSDYPRVTTIRQPTDVDNSAMDIPLLRDVDDEPGYYVALHPRWDVTPLCAVSNPAIGEPQWIGGVFLQSFGGGLQEVFRTDRQAIYGFAAENSFQPLPNWTGGAVFDESSTLEVEIVDGELSSSTREAMLSDLSINLALVGNEIVRFRTATLIGGKTYLLSSFLRGQRGTEWAMSGHGYPERFVLLEKANLRRVTDSINRVGTERIIASAAFGANLDNIDSYYFTNTGESLRPLSVANLRALGSGSDLAVTWQRRTRREYAYGGSVGVYVPLGENSERYKVDIYDGPTLVRTDYATTTAYNYTAANAAADGFSSGDTVTVVVAQVSEIVGAGRSATASGRMP
jgi:hypothetical protein